MRQYAQKAIHEAKVHTSWINPNAAYDEGVNRFVTRVLDEKCSPKFLREFRDLHGRISHCGLFNALAQTLIKITAPGVPDIYQGTELWDFSLVDPDNRRPVDFARRQRLLEDLKREFVARGDRLAEFARELVLAKEAGRIKALREVARINLPPCPRRVVFEGRVLAWLHGGKAARALVRFVRRNEAHWALVAVPRLVTRLIPNPGDLPMGEYVWQDT